MDSLAGRQMVGLPNIKMGRRREVTEIHREGGRKGAIYFLEQPAIMKKRFLSVSPPTCVGARATAKHKQQGREASILGQHCHIFYIY